MGAALEAKSLTKQYGGDRCGARAGPSCDNLMPDVNDLALDLRDPP